MRSVSKKTGVSKKAARDRRILAKARREDGGKPVSDGIRRAAEKIGAKLDGLPTLPDTVTIPREALRDMLEHIEDVPRYVAEVWSKVEELADEANACTWLVLNRESGKNPTDKDMLFDNIEERRRAVSKNMMFVLSSFESLREELSQPAYGTGKYVVAVRAVAS
jgi:hypothetical protein